MRRGIRGETEGGSLRKRRINEKRKRTKGNTVRREELRRRNV